MLKSTTVGLVPTERLIHIPPELHVKHEFCYHIHDLMVTFLIDYETSGAGWTKFESDASMSNQYEGLTSEELLTNLGESRPDVYRDVLVKTLVPALLSDLLHFLFEALSCLERRKFTVALSLLRKPLKENLLHLAYLLADPVEYIRRLDEKPYHLLDVQLRDQVNPKEIFRSVVEMIPFKSSFDADFLAELIYDKSAPWGFEVLCQKSMHLVTSHGGLMKTEVGNLNFIFKDPSDDDVYEFIYGRMPLVLMFILNVVVSLFKRCHPVNERVVFIWFLRAVGAFEALFESSGTAQLRSSIRRQLREFFRCTHCRKPLRLTQSRAPAFFLTENISCASCGVEQHFPLSWLLSRCEFTLENV